jgi:katanin p60 ATPase-containing subunit A1
MQARETNARRAEDRKRSVLVLAQRFLLEHNMPDSARALEREGGVPLKTFDAADNASLTHVLAEWEALHEERFGFRPKVTRRADDPPPGSSAAALAATKGKAGAKAGAERRAARIAAEREASRAGITGTNIDEAQASTSTSATGDVLPSDFDVPPGHPSLRRYASDGVAKPAGGTTLSNAMDYVAKRDAERRGDVAPSGTEHLGKTHSESHLDAGGYRGFMNGHQSKHETRLNGVGEGTPGGAEGGAESNDDGDDGTHHRSIPGAWEERHRVLKPPPTFGGSVELRDLARVITRDIYTSNPDVRFRDVSGCDEAKRLLKEAVVMPVKYPQFFHGLLRPWRGILLYGPPGTGKTMLAKAVATECGTTFFNISASSVVSKWRGDSEKLVRVLFELARHHAPSTVFMDELDAVMSARDGGGSGGSSSGGGDHESSRRLKTELLVQMDGLNRDEGELVFLLAATNLPWELDPAMLRRLEKRIHVGLPGEDARRRMMSRYLEPHDVADDVDLAALAAKTDGYSGADVMLLCKEGAMRPLRRLMDRLNDDLEPAGFGDDEVTVGEITGDDIVGALSATRPTQTEAHAKRYVEWTNSFGAVL